MDKPIKKLFESNIRAYHFLNKSLQYKTERRIKVLQVLP